MNRANLLALDTVGGAIHGCIITAEQTFCASEGGSGKTRSTAILPLVDQLLRDAALSWMDLNALAYSAGPGSFTGLRIAAATLAGINSGLNLPILHLSSLAVTARQAGVDGPVWVLEDARAGEAFVGCYDSGKAVCDDRCMRWYDIETDFEPARFIAMAEPDSTLSGWQRLPLLLNRADALAVEAKSVAAVANWPEAVIYPQPRYLQVSQAERSATHV